MFLEDWLMNCLVKIPLFACCIVGLFCMNAYAANEMACKQVFLSVFLSGKFEKAVPICKEGCSLGFGSDCYVVGVLYHNGRGIRLDYRKAKAYYEEACNLNEGHGCKFQQSKNLL